ncbi:hypothetical protein BH11PSE8_BH11PSE8_38410 [soil metagenome]
MSQTNHFSPNQIDTLQARFGLRVAAALTERNQNLSADLSESLRFAREQALARARVARQAQAASLQGGVTHVGVTSSGAAVLGKRFGGGLAGGMGSGSSWWFKIASAAPVVALLAGLVLIERWQGNAQITTAAEIDAALLSDDVPPAAYADAGFVEFLKTPPRE